MHKSTNTDTIILKLPLIFFVTKLSDCKNNINTTTRYRWIRKLYHFLLKRKISIKCHYLVTATDYFQSWGSHDGEYKDQGLLVWHIGTYLAHYTASYFRRP
jgi:nuclear transport factor 2 (NTF2) superfamily protein